MESESDDDLNEIIRANENAFNEANINLMLEKYQHLVYLPYFKEFDKICLDYCNLLPER